MQAKVNHMRPSIMTAVAEPSQESLNSVVLLDHQTHLPVNTISICSGITWHMQV